jgi:hypothetical protein
VRLRLSGAPRGNQYHRKVGYTTYLRSRDFFEAVKDRRLSAGKLRCSEDRGSSTTIGSKQTLTGGLERGIRLVSLNPSQSVRTEEPKNRLNRHAPEPAFNRPKRYRLRTGVRFGNFRGCMVRLGAAHVPVAVMVELRDFRLQLFHGRFSLGLRLGCCFLPARLRHATPFPGRSLPLDSPTETVVVDYAAAFRRSSSMTPGFAFSKAVSSASFMLEISANCCSTV